MYIKRLYERAMRVGKFLKVLKIDPIVYTVDLVFW